jgi:hypothetical protein
MRLKNLVEREERKSMGLVSHATQGRGKRQARRARNAPDRPPALPPPLPLTPSSPKHAEPLSTGLGEEGAKPASEKVDDEERRRDPDEGEGELLRAEELIDAGEGEIDVNL